MKDFFKILGLVAIIIVAALNLRHAGNNYGLQTNSLWSEVGAQTTSTGGEGGCSGTQCNYVYCLWEGCIDISNYEECMPLGDIFYLACMPPIFFWDWIKMKWGVVLYCFDEPFEVPECELYFGKKHKCTTEYHDPTLFEVEIKTECYQCVNYCKKTTSPN